MTDHHVATLTGREEVLTDAALRDLRSNFAGEVVGHTDAAYEKARRIWNGLVDRKPALVAYCARTEDVVAVVRFARKLDALTSVRSGGHNIWGTSVCEGGIVIDLSRLKSIRVDADARIVTVGPGARFKELDKETQEHALATPGGQHSEVGVGGFTLGGGIGWLVRKHGLGCDNLKRAQVVTADGSLLTASATEHEDLFWALRGGGGSFGIVTSFELALHPVGPTVVAGMVMHPYVRAREVLRFFRDFSEACPEDLHVIAVLMTSPVGQKAIALAVCHEGASKEGESVLRELRAFGAPVMDQVQPIPYAALQGMMDGLAPAGRCYFNRSRFMRAADDAIIDELVTQFGRAPSPQCTLFLHRMGGAMSRVDNAATAFAHRDAAYCFVAEASWVAPEDRAAHENWARAAEQAVGPYATGAYLNDRGREEDDGMEPLRACFGRNYERLALVKRKYDPDNVFRHNQNVRPAER
jgi:FAD/FMN-containing dehydrogenase